MACNTEDMENVGMYDVIFSKNEIPDHVRSSGIMFCVPGGDNFVNLLDDEYVPSVRHIAMALSSINRYSGRCSPFYSVAAHSINMAKAFLADDDRDAARLAMIHDCSEIFTGDVPSPIKKMAPAISAFEDYMVAKVSLDLFKCTFDHNVARRVKVADKIIGWHEMAMYVDTNPFEYMPPEVNDDEYGWLSHYLENAVAETTDGVRKMEGEYLSIMMELVHEDTPVGKFTRIT